MKNLNTFKLLSDYESEKSGGVLNTPNVSFVEEDNSVKYLLENTISGNFENGYEWVDLGLPSGLKWATCNVGATSPEKAGLYFAWGETTGYTAEQVENGRRVFDEESYGLSFIHANLTLEQDAAHVNLGGNWRMPTKAECQELLDNCDGMRTDDYNGTGVTGYVITSKINGNSVFFPAAGYGNGSFVGRVGSDGRYWSASWQSTYLSWILYFDSRSQDMDYNNRYLGFSVRGVCE